MNNRVRCYNVVRYLHVNVRYITSDAVTLTALKHHSAGRAGASPMTRTHVQLSEPHEVQLTVHTELCTSTRTTIPRISY